MKTQRLEKCKLYSKILNRLINSLVGIFLFIIFLIEKQIEGSKETYLLRFYVDTQD